MWLFVICDTIAYFLGQFSMAVSNPEGYQDSPPQGRFQVMDCSVEAVVWLWEQILLCLPTYVVGQGME